MRKLYDGAEMRAMDKWTIEAAGIPGVELMERAAHAVAERILQGECAATAIICGTGNNGGDGYAAARMLREAGCRADVYVIGDPGRIRGDAKVNYDRLGGQGVFAGLPGETAGAAAPAAAGASVSAGAAGLEPAAVSAVSTRYTCVVDALFGTGLDRPLAGEALAAVQWINAWKAADARRRVIAVDIPSGIHAGTGQILGDAVRADETVTISRWKTGLLLYPGRTYAGKVYLEDIGEEEPNPVSDAARTRCYSKKDIRRILPARSADSHKGTYGKLLVAAGSPGMMGAAVFAASAAYRAGAGLVNTVIPAEEGQTMTLAVPEAVQTRYKDSAGCADQQARANDLTQLRLPECSAAVVGPGLGKNVALLRKVLAMRVPTVVDADALNLIAADPSILKESRVDSVAKDFASDAGNCPDNSPDNAVRLIFTPHMGEAARLSGKTVAELYQDLPGNAAELAKRFHAVVVLKNASTVIADPEGRICVNRTGNNGMSTAGSGDVLAGTIGGLLAQAASGGLDGTGSKSAAERLFELACAGVWLHGKAGDAAAKRTGYYALTASDLVRYMRPDRLVK